MSTSKRDRADALSANAVFRPERGLIQADLSEREADVVLYPSHLIHPALDELGSDPVMRDGLLRSHFLSPAVQFSTTVIGAKPLSSVPVLMRNRPVPETSQ